MTVKDSGAKSDVGSPPEGFKMLKCAQQHNMLWLQVSKEAAQSSSKVFWVTYNKKIFDSHHMEQIMTSRSTLSFDRTIGALGQADEDNSGKELDAKHSDNDCDYAMLVALPS